MGVNHTHIGHMGFSGIIEHLAYNHGKDPAWFQENFPFNDVQNGISILNALHDKEHGE